MASDRPLKIALIRTPIIQPAHHVTSLRAVPSIGIAYINAALTQAGHSVTMIDAPGEALFRFHKIPGTNLVVNGLSASEICSRIPEDADLVGVSVMHANEWIYDREIIRAVTQKKLRWFLVHHDVVIARQLLKGIGG